jgi:uncharacterized protein
VTRRRVKGCGDVAKEGSSPVLDGPEDGGSSFSDPGARLVRAREPILAGEVVEIIGGTLMTQAEFETFLASAKRFNVVQVAEDMHLIEMPEVTKVRGGSVNHSCDSNLWMADEATVVARRDIGEGKELTLDYALHTVNPDWELDGPCNCGSALCRGSVRGCDWRLTEV